MFSELHTLLPSYTNSEGQLKDKPLKLVAIKHS